jgi:hypothetical protein
MNRALGFMVQKKKILSAELHLRTQAHAVNRSSLLEGARAALDAGDVRAALYLTLDYLQKK